MMNKMCASIHTGRPYRSDLSDMIVILFEDEKRRTPNQQIRKAVTDLYGSWDALLEASQAFIENVMNSNQLAELYEQTATGEKETKQQLIQFVQEYPSITKESNVDSIAGTLQKKTNRSSALALLWELRQAKERATFQMGNAWRPRLPPRQSIYSCPVFATIYVYEEFGILPITENSGGDCSLPPFVF